MASLAVGILLRICQVQYINAQTRKNDAQVKAAIEKYVALIIERLKQEANNDHPPQGLKKGEVRSLHLRDEFAMQAFGGRFTGDKRGRSRFEVMWKKYVEKEINADRRIRNQQGRVFKNGEAWTTDTVWSWSAGGR